MAICLFSPKKVQSIVKAFSANWDDFLVSRYDRIPHGMIQLSRNIVVFCIAFVFAFGMAFVSFEYLSVNKTIKRFP